MKRAATIERRTAQELPKIMTVGELAPYLRVHPSTIYRLIKKREIPAFKVGRDWRFTLELIDRWRLARTGYTASYRGKLHDE